MVEEVGIHHYQSSSLFDVSNFSKPFFFFVNDELFDG
jgi:hypothetical protein